MKEKCTCYRIVDGLECESLAKYEIKFDNRHVGFACGTHARAYGSKALFPLVTTTGKSPTPTT